MQTFGEVRRVDDLGRIVIPKVVRENLNIKEGEPLEVLFDKEKDMVCFKKIHTPTAADKIKEVVNDYKSQLPPVAQDLLNVVVKILRDNEDNDDEES